jgi:hypothetical protein
MNECLLYKEERKKKIDINILFLHRASTTGLVSFSHAVSISQQITQKGTTYIPDS